MAAGFNAEFAWNCCFTAHTALIGIEGPVHFHGLGHFSVDWIAFLFFFFFFPDMYFASRNGGVLGFSGNQRTADKSGDHRPQILPWRR